MIKVVLIHFKSVEMSSIRDYERGETVGKVLVLVFSLMV
jgi:hypothetical protein